MRSGSFLRYKIPTGLIEALVRIGILGMGSIGGIVARHMQAFGAKVVYHNRNKLPTECMSFPKLL